MATRLLCYKCEQLGCSYWSEHRAYVLNSQRQTFWRLARDSWRTTNIVISCLAYSCTNRQKTGFNISLFSGNLGRKYLCCVSVYVNECNSFENVLKYQYITDTFAYVFPSSHIDWEQHKMLTIFVNSTRCQLINKIFVLY